MTSCVARGRRLRHIRVVAKLANQARVYALDPTARSRLNTVFMATMLLGGSGWRRDRGRCLLRLGLDWHMRVWRGLGRIGVAAVSKNLTLRILCRR